MDKSSQTWCGGWIGCNDPAGALDMDLMCWEVRHLATNSFISFYMPSQYTLDRIRLKVFAKN